MTISEVQTAIQSMQKGVCYLQGGATTDQQWTIRYKEGYFIEESWNVYSLEENMISEEEVYARLLQLPSHVVKTLS